MISRTSTFVIFTPQRSVTSSSFACSTTFIWSRCERMSSSAMSPTTLRSVVAAMFSAAPAKFCTLTTESTASTTRWKTMKSIEIGALSFVIPVWRGISRYCSRRSTSTGRSITGIRKMIPGPLAPMHAAEAEDDVALVLADDADAQVEEAEQEQHRDDRADDGAEHVAETLVPPPGRFYQSVTGVTMPGCDSAPSSSGCGRSTRPRPTRAATATRGADVRIVHLEPKRPRYQTPASGRGPPPLVRAQARRARAARTSRRLTVESSTTRSESTASAGSAPA